MSNLGNSSSSVETITSSSSKVVVNNYNAETGILTDERDGETYKTAKIGDQIWMGENLRYLHTITAENSCHGQDEDSDITDSILSIYGRHYSWIAAMNLPCEYCGEFAYSATETPVVRPPHQGLCPTGWHIPSVDDWQELFNHASVESILSTDWTKEDHGLVGTDDFGFTLHSARFEVEDYPKFHVIEYSGAAEPPVRKNGSHHSGPVEPPVYSSFVWSNTVCWDRAGFYKPIRAYSGLKI